MPPEPTQEPSSTLSAANIDVNVITTNGSDSEDEEIGNTMYMPLPQDPVEGDSTEENNEEEEVNLSILLIP